MSLCIDLVLNHTAREHPWARGWLAGDPEFADFYFAFPDRTMPDRYEQTINDVFPEQAPGSFSWVPEACGGAGGWVWTTFFDYQWDLDYANPKVFAAVLDTVLWLANRGIEIFRLDAVPFMWKRMGTSCLNQPEVHELLQALHALVKLAAPGVVFKAEAIVSPDDLVPYLGGHQRYRPECELAYHNQLMVMLWSALATKDARLATQSLRRMRPIPADASWATYVRCHDDIGWAVSDLDARAIGYDPFAHRDFLNAFYSGQFPMSFARGARFGENPQTGDARISGSAAALVRHLRRAGPRRRARAGAGHPPAGAAARGDLRLGRGAADLHGRRAGAGQRRELPGRSGAGRRTTAGCTARSSTTPPPPAGTIRSTVEGRIFGWLVALGAARRQLPALHAAAETTVLDVGSPQRARLAPPAPAQRLVRRAGQLRRAPGLDRRAGTRTPTASWTRCCPATARGGAERRAAAARAGFRLARRAVVNPAVSA